MKFWIDENIPRPLSKALQRAGHQVFMAPARSSDPAILRLAVEENAVILTRDQDFRKYVFDDGWPCTGVIWLRIPSTKKYGELAVRLLRLVADNEDILATSFIIFSLDQTRIISLGLF
jgi:predicted nuclease of predicted toxin-antitoxin system